MSKVIAYVGENVIAESENTVLVEGNHYFPLQDIKKEIFSDSDTHTVCHWKGEASYYNIEINNQKLEDAAWYYPNPSDAAKNIKDHVAFWRGVIVEEK